MVELGTATEHDTLHIKVHNMSQRCRSSFPQDPRRYHGSFFFVLAVGAARLEVRSVRQLCPILAPSPVIMLRLHDAEDEQSLQAEEGQPTARLMCGAAGLHIAESSRGDEILTFSSTTNEGSRSSLLPLVGPGTIP